MRKRKNILVFVLDQLAWRALPAYGCTWTRTPSIDSIARRGVAASACYCPVPLCQPSRAAFWSSRYAHRSRVWSNGRACQVTPLPSSVPTLGETFRLSGWETRHFGKKHDAGGLRGFWCDEEKEEKIPDEDPLFPLNMDSYADAYTVRRAVEYLSAYRGEKPLLMVVDLVNPHNICGWVGANKGIHENRFGEKDLPPLPSNFRFDDIKSRPLPVQYLCCSHIRQSQTVGWTEKDFRSYLAAYAYYLSRADRDVGQVLDALRKSGREEETLVVFLSDHGDSLASRGSVTKQTTLYEEVTRVPLIFAGPGVVPRKKPVEGLCSLLDLFPTLCAWAGVPIPCRLDGKDISLLLSEGKLPNRPYVASEWFTEWGYTFSPGRMIRSGAVKYISYLEGEGEELYFLDKDPGETHNAIRDPEAGRVAEEMRKKLAAFISETDDPFLSLPVIADKRWRSHALGYQNHRGCAAPEAAREEKK